MAAGLTSCPAGIQSYVWFCRWWHQPTARLQYWRRRLCGMWTPQSSSAHMSEDTDNKISNHTKIKHTRLRVKHPETTHIPIAAHSCLPGHWQSDRPNWAWCLLVDWAGNHFQPGWQSKKKSLPKLGSYLRSKRTNREFGFLSFVEVDFTQW